GEPHADDAASMGVVDVRDGLEGALAGVDDLADRPLEGLAREEGRVAAGRRAGRFDAAEQTRHLELGVERAQRPSVYAGVIGPVRVERDIDVIAQRDELAREVGLRAV